MPIYNCATASLPAHACDPCLEDAEHGRVRAALFFTQDAIDSLFSAAIPETGIPAATLQALIETDDIILVGPVSGTFDGGSPIEGAGFGAIQTRVTGYTNTLVYNDPAYKKNCQFYDVLQKSSVYYGGFLTETQLHISDAPVSVRVANPVTDTVTDLMQWVVTVIWQSTGLTCPITLDTSDGDITAKCAGDTEAEG